MRVTLDIDYYEDDEFSNFIECIEERKEILRQIENFNAGTLYELELSMYFNKKIYLYLNEENIKKNKDWVKRTLELMLETNERDTLELMERLNIEHYD